MASEIQIKNAIIILAIIAVVAIAGTYLALTKPGADVSGLVAGTATVNVSEVVAISMPNNVVSFGIQSVGSTNETSWQNLSATPYPFTLQNDGNTWTNVTVYASILFLSQIGGSNYQVNSSSMESGVFNGTGSSYNISWTNMPLSPGSQTLIAGGMNYSDSADLAYINIKITVPTLEAKGNRTSTVTFTASAF